MKLSKISAALVLAAAAINTQAFAHNQGDWLVRGGITQVSPDDSSSNVFVDGADLGVGVNVDSNAQLGLNLAYFFTPKWNVELLAATPFSHDIGLNTVGDLGSTKHLPPSLTANYYLLDGASSFQPYVGAGVNYTIFFDEDFTAANQTAGFNNLDLDASFGLTAQVGADFKIDKKWHVNASVRWIDIDTEATFDLNGAAGKVNVDIDPYVYTVSIGYTF